MKLSRREYALALATLVAVLAAITLTVGTAQWKILMDARKQREALVASRLAYELRIERKPQLQRRVDELWGAIPVYPADLDVSADLLRQIESLASQNQLTLTRREPEKERNVGNLTEVSIHASWEGGLDPLTRFLYAVQNQGAMFDIRQLTINPPKGSNAVLSGTFTVDCAYTRKAVGGGTAQPATNAPPRKP